MTGKSDSPIARLRRLKDAGLGGTAPDHADMAWLAAAISKYEDDAPHGLKLDTALGLKPGPGCDAWWKTEARAARNAAILALHQNRFADMELPKSANEIVRLVDSHKRPGRNVAPADQVTERLISAALCTGLPFPGPKQVTNILEMK